MSFNLANSQKIDALDAKLSQLLALLAQPPVPSVEPLLLNTKAGYLLPTAVLVSPKKVRVSVVHT